MHGIEAHEFGVAILLAIPTISYLLNITSTPVRTKQPELWKKIYTGKLSAKINH